MLKDKILNKQSGIVLYGLTPPKLDSDIERIRNIANKQIERLKNIGIDGLVLYDIQDESQRNDNPRPFPFMQTLAPDEYSANFLGDLHVPKIIYKSVGKYTSDEFKNWLKEKNNQIDFSVFVGSPSKHQTNHISLQDAYKIKMESSSPCFLGGVTIPERHIKKGDEHLRVFDKMNNGCSFFISQCVYSVNDSKNFLSDYYYTAQEKNIAMAPIIFTLTPCGSVKTLQFMEWLGIHIPNWLNKDLKHSEDILGKSFDICKKIAVELIEYSKEKKIPIGFNVESVSIRKEEIEVSIELLKFIKTLNF